MPEHPSVDSKELALAQLAAIVESSEDAIISKDIDGVIQTWNAGAERIYGYSPAEVIGQPMMSLLPKGLLDQEREILAKIRRGERVHHFETVRIHKSGRPVPVSLTISPIRSQSGQIIGASHVARDISESRDLRHKLQLSQKMEALGRLAGGVAHDFNNLLTIISGYAALLRVELKNHATHADMVNEVIGAAERASELTRQLLAFSRREPRRLQWIDINECLAKNHAMLRRLIGEDIEIVLKPGEKLLKVHADPNQIAQVLLNLAANARDAMPEGGKIIIDTSVWNVDDQYHERLGFAPGCYVRLLFTDTGCGMDAETQARIFEPFFTTKDIGSGTGLGLSTVYGIVKQSGGQISVYSEPGCGTTFAIYLPCGGSEPAESRIPEPEIARGSATVLLVEDEPSLRKLAHSILTNNGYTVLTAANAEEAFAQCKRHPSSIDLLLTDIVMPGGDGHKLAGKISELRPGIRIMFMSGYSEHATLQTILSDPDAAFLQKPFTPIQLLQKVHEFLPG